MLLLTSLESEQQRKNFRFEIIKNKLLACGNSTVILTCKNEHEHEVPLYCHLPICQNPACVRNRSFIYKKKFLPRLLRIPKYVGLYFITLTFGRVHWEFDWKKIRLAALKFLKKHYTMGGMFSTEIVPKFQGYYLHFHAVAMGYYIQQEQLQRDWGHIVDVRCVKKPRATMKISSHRAINYVLKYVTKAPRAVNNEFYAKQYMMMFYKQKRVQCWGKFYNVPTLSETKKSGFGEFCCPECGENLYFLTTIESCDHICQQNRELMMKWKKPPSLAGLLDERQTGG